MFLQILTELAKEKKEKIVKIFSKRTMLSSNREFGRTHFQKYFD